MDDKKTAKILELKAAVYDQIEIIKKCQIETIPTAEKEMNRLINELKEHATT